MDRAKFFAAVRASGVLGAALTAGQVANVEMIIDEGQKRGVPLRHLAYALGTARHEVGAAMAPISENLNYSAKRLTQVWPSRFPTTGAANPYANNPQKLANKVYAGRMGNGPEASGDGGRFIGRGYPQVTGKENYAKVSKFVGVDLVANPNRLMEPKIAAIAMLEGMTRGTFTGKRFADYLTGDKPQWGAARAIINGDVEVNGLKVAGYAGKFAEALRTAGYLGQAPAPSPAPPVATAPVVPAKPAPTIPATLEPAKPATVSVPPPGGEVEHNPFWRVFLAILRKLFGRK